MTDMQTVTRTEPERGHPDPHIAARQEKAILELFHRQGNATTAQLSGLAPQYNARIYGLRRQGHRIHHLGRLADGTHAYSYLGFGHPIPTQKSLPMAVVCPHCGGKLGRA